MTRSDKGTKNPFRGARGERHKGAKLTQQDHDEIIQALANGITGVALAKAFNVTPGAISHIKNGRTWSNTNNSPEESNYDDGIPIWNEDEIFGE